MGKHFWIGVLGVMVAFSAGAVEKGARPSALSEDPVVEEQFAVALELHQKGVEGDEDAVVEAQQILEQLLEREPTNARVQAFLGNLYALRARDAIFYKKMGWLRKGEETLDGAVAAAPDDPSVRSVRAINSFKLPRIFGRRDLAEEDFGLLMDWAENDPSRFSDDLRRFVLYHAGQFYGERDEARGRELLEKARSVPGGSVSDEEIEEQLREMR